jgi:hypothetical protein
MADRKISGNFIGALVFAIALWGYTSLNDSYITFVEVPLSIELPSDRAIENSVPSQVTLELRGTGWNLFNLIFFNSAKVCKVDLRGEKNLKDYSVSRQLMMKSVEYLSNVETRDVMPASIDLATGRILERKVAVKFVGEIIPHSDFIISSAHNIEPKEVVLRGNENIINNIEYWKTKTFLLDGLTKGSEMKIELSDSLSTIVSKNIDYITLTSNVQQKAQLIIDNIPVQILGHKSKKIIIQPNRVKIIIKGGIDQLENFDISTITASVSSKDISSNKTGIIVPKLTSDNPNIEIELYDTKYLYIIKNRNKI